ncbi:hypothetical protein HMPREF9629_01434 [Peptoanaerobacter stomatis]|uniref:YARHG domain-containing protein n=2 Tax=Peptoanaerobacter stomatis TaxID=796937 RepID=G9WZ33_9FIRM|nr:hypothetical protein HMPREF9629_01434 [Peptoanaerobacter stomatis]
MKFIKKLSLIIIFVFSLILLCSCSNKDIGSHMENNIKADTQVSKTEIKDFFNENFSKNGKLDENQLEIFKAEIKNAEYEKSLERELLDYIKQIQLCNIENYAIQQKYDFDILSKPILSKTFYVTQKFKYDNMIGEAVNFLSEEIEDSKGNTKIDWVAYDAVYDNYLGMYPNIKGQAYILRTSKKFANVGAYSLDYIDNGDKIMTTDANGFEKELPVYEILGDLGRYTFEELDYDRSVLMYNDSMKFQIYENISLMLENEKTIESMEKLRDRNYILPTNTLYVSKKEIVELADLKGKDIIRYAINEIYARYGYSFKMEEFKNYFESKPWYKKSDNLTQEYIQNNLMNEYEKKNLETLLFLEDALKDF